MNDPLRIELTEAEREFLIWGLGYMTGAAKRHEASPDLGRHIEKHRQTILPKLMAASPTDEPDQVDVRRSLMEP